LQTRIDDTIAIAALRQSLAAALVDRFDAGEPLPVHDTQRIAENRRLAMRDGLDGELSISTAAALPPRAPGSVTSSASSSRTACRSVLAGA
jgi:gamma-glutamyl:cysteine ligase YbdK (ATP-grasp superfamily)